MLPIFSSICWCLLAVIIVLRPGQTAVLFEPCTSNPECTVSSSQCKIISPSCGINSCACIPGFKALNGSTCGRAVSYGGTCKINVDACATEGAECIDKVCKCPAGQRTGPGSNSVFCSANRLTIIGEKCDADSDCYAEYSYCSTVNKRCSCRPGFRNAGNYVCLPKSIGDVCESTPECTNLPNMFCASGKCGCVKLARKELITLNYWNFTGNSRQEAYDNVYACFLGDRPQFEGQSCTYDYATAFQYVDGSISAAIIGNIGSIGSDGNWGSNNNNGGIGRGDNNGNHNGQLGTQGQGNDVNTNNNNFNNGGGRNKRSVDVPVLAKYCAPPYACMQCLRGLTLCAVKMRKFISNGGNSFSYGLVCRANLIVPFVLMVYSKF